MIFYLDYIPMLELIHRIMQPVTHTVILAKRADKPSFKWIEGKPDVKFRLVSPSVFDENINQ